MLGSSFGSATSTVNNYLSLDPKYQFLKIKGKPSVNLNQQKQDMLQSVNSLKSQQEQQSVGLLNNKDNVKDMDLSSIFKRRKSKKIIPPSMNSQTTRALFIQTAQPDNQKSNSISR